jgi:hypothetical protein
MYEYMQMLLLQEHKIPVQTSINTPFVSQTSWSSGLTVDLHILLALYCNMLKNIGTRYRKQMKHRTQLKVVVGWDLETV